VREPSLGVHLSLSTVAVGYEPFLRVLQCLAVSLGRQANLNAVIGLAVRDANADDLLNLGFFAA